MKKNIMITGIAIICIVGITAGFVIVPMLLTPPPDDNGSTIPWPTDNWSTSTPEEQDMNSTILSEMYDFIEENRPSKMVIDFEGLKFFSSEVLGMLLTVRTKLQSYEGKVVISAIDPQLHRVFKITNLDKIFEFFPDQKSAVEAMDTN